METYDLDLNEKGYIDAAIDPSFDLVNAILELKKKKMP